MGNRAGGVTGGGGPPAQGIRDGLPSLVPSLANPSPLVPFCPGQN